MKKISGDNKLPQFKNKSANKESKKKIKFKPRKDKKKFKNHNSQLPLEISPSGKLFKSHNKNNINSNSQSDSAGPADPQEKQTTNFDSNKVKRKKKNNNPKNPLYFTKISKNQCQSENLQNPKEVDSNLLVAKDDLIKNRKKIKIKKSLSIKETGDNNSQEKNDLGKKKKKKNKPVEKSGESRKVSKKTKRNNIPNNTGESESHSDVSDFDIDSYPSDSDEEIGESLSRVNYAEESSDSSSDESDNESNGTFDAESYPSDTDDEDEKKKGLPLKAIPSAELEEREERTIFVGNLPKTVERKELKKWFFKFGPVECVRLRSAPIADPELPRKVAVIKKTFHESRSNIHAYVRFKTVQAAENALQANGAVFQDYMIRVDRSVHKDKYDSNKAVFVGNIPFAVEENSLQKFFSDCGEIDNVRIIRDKSTGVGKGFGYVNFKCSSSVPLALKLDGEIIEKRALRIKPIKYQKKNAVLKKGPPPQYHSKKFFRKPFNKTKVMKKANKFQGEISQKKVRKQPKKKNMEERKREKFSQIFANKNNQKK